ncbi:MAG TPA: hypothetical protein DCF78_10420, partial [Dehalococcoidia bacterium]|nr:hypothetical protein [Dehalococcoidia bacterium]
MLSVKLSGLWSGFLSYVQCPLSRRALLLGHALQRKFPGVIRYFVVPSRYARLRANVLSDWQFDFRIVGFPAGSGYFV